MAGVAGRLLGLLLFARDALVVVARNKKALAGLLILSGFGLMALAGPYVIDYPRSYTCEVYLRPTILKWPPSLDHPLGCDYKGTDIFAQIVWGSRVVLEIAFIAGLITTIVGVAVGMSAGFLGGRVDNALMLVTDAIMTIPGLPLLIVLASLIKTSNPLVIGAILSATAWTGLARSIRSQVLVYKSSDFVEAAVSLGLPWRTIVFSEIMPNLMSFIAINFVFATIGAVYGSVGLYFLGVLPYTQFNWGIMLNTAYSQAGALFSLSTIHYIMAPILAIVLLQVGLVLSIYAIDEIFNPRLREKALQG